MAVAYTPRQQIADAPDPANRRHLLLDAWDELLAAGRSPAEAAYRLGIEMDEYRRARDAVRAAIRRNTERNQVQ